eukprot:749332-Hanusia_phi.AAC.3
MDDCYGGFAHTTVDCMPHQGLFDEDKSQTPLRHTGRSNATVCHLHLLSPPSIRWEIPFDLIGVVRHANSRTGTCLVLEAASEAPRQPHQHWVPCSCTWPLPFT